MAEATSINSALSALGRVVLGLVERDGQRASHVPYMDSPLTYLLKSGLGGNSKTALIACVTAADDSFDESVNTLRFATQASHVKNAVAAKDARAGRAAADAAVESAGHALALADGAGEVAPPGADRDGVAHKDWAPSPLREAKRPYLEVALPGGAVVSVRGRWGDGGGVPLLCLTDSSTAVHGEKAEPTQFDGVLAALDGDGGFARALTVDLRIDKDKEPYPFAATLLALMDHLGVARAVLYGRDAGALVACALRVAQPKRVAALVIENRRERCDEAQFKKRMKKDPNYCFGGYGGPWMMIAGAAMLDSSGGTTLKDLKKLGGRIVLLWPQHKSGRPAKNYVMDFCKAIMKVVKAIQLVDSYQFTDADIAKELKAVLAPKGGAPKNSAKPVGAAAAK